MDSIALVVACLIITLLSALLTTYIAQGRSFWRWFLIGLVLPYLSIFIAMLVVYRDHRAAEKANGR